MTTAPSPDIGPYAQGFEAYWSAGWRGIIPVTGKYPPEKGWTGADADYPSYADVHTWANGPEGSRNIALRLPATVLGIDVDAYGDKRGRTTLAECEANWGALPPTWRSTSRDDGISGIRLFGIPAGLEWPGQLPGGGVELIRYDHRYCMVWPSIHPEGRVYHWISREGAISLGPYVPRPDSLPALPGQWIGGLVRGAEKADHKADLNASVFEWLSSLSGANDPPCGVALVHTNDLIDGLISATLAGTSRHEVITGPLLNLLRTFEKGHPGCITQIGLLQKRFIAIVTEDGTRSVRTAASEFARELSGACRQIQGDRTWPAPTADPCRWMQFANAGAPAQVPAAVTGSLGINPAGSAQVSGTPWQNAGHNPREDPAALFAERVRWLRADRAAREFLADEKSPPAEDMPALMELDAMLSQPDSATRYRITGVLPTGGRVLFSAQMKSGKTTFLANLIRSLVDGVPFLGRFDIAPLPAGSTVVLLDNEMHEDTLRRWLREQGIRNTAAVRVSTMLGRTRTFDIRLPRVAEYWANTLGEMKCGVLIVDCLKPILDSLDLDERSETGAITTPLTQLKLEADIGELVLSHHTGHGGERARGDSALRGWPEVEWNLVLMRESEMTEPDQNAQRFFKAYGRDVYVPESALEFDNRTRHMTIVGGSRREVRKAEQFEDVEVDVVNVIYMNPGISTNKLADELGYKKNGSQYNAMRALLDTLAGERRIERRDGPNRSQLHYPPSHVDGDVRPPGSLWNGQGSEG